MKPSDFPRDARFHDPSTPPFSDESGMYHVSSHADVMRVLQNKDQAFSRDQAPYLAEGAPAHMAVIYGGTMAGLGGSFLSLASAGQFFPDIVAGRGWIALAIVIFGNWRASWILAGSLLFGFLEATQLSLQASDIDLPYQLLLALPFVLTIAALVFNRSRSRVPLALTIPYHRGVR